MATAKAASSGKSATNLLILMSDEHSRQVTGCYIGKLHFRSRADDNGFSDEILSMHVKDGRGDLLGLIRDDLPVREMSWKMARLAGAGDKVRDIPASHVDIHPFIMDCVREHDPAPREGYPGESLFDVIRSPRAVSHSTL